MLKEYFVHKFFPAIAKSVRRAKASALNPYKDLRAAKYFDKRLTDKTEWNYPSNKDAYQALEENDIYTIWKDIPEGVKWHHYFKSYQRIFGHCRHQELKILEIGVLRGASLSMWRQYFDHPNTKIVGIDIKNKCTEYEDADNGVFVRIGSQASEKFLASVVEEFGEFDIVIDDGSHLASHLMASFNYLYKDALKDQGIYFIEDTHTAYWQRFRDASVSIQDYAYQAVNYINNPYTAYEHDDFLFEEGDKNPLLVPYITKTLEEVRFFDSIIVFYKNVDKFPPMDIRNNW